MHEIAMTLENNAEPRFCGYRIRLDREEAEFLVDQCERGRNPRWMALAADIRKAFRMGKFPAGAVPQDDGIALTSIAHPLSLDVNSIEAIEIECPRAFYQERRFEAATRAMQGLAAGIGWSNGGTMVDCDGIAEDAIAMADALLSKLGIRK